jgi:VanZ family protein
MISLLLAVAASALMVLSGPFVGELNTSLQNAFPGQHLRIIATVVVAPALVALGAAVARIRELRLLRYGALVVAVALAVTYVAVMQPIYTEQFHLTEYGVLAFLFYRVWRYRADVTTFVLPVVAALVAGIADEWFQWFIPSRVGELKDVGLNSIGILAGLLFAAALFPPVRLRAFANDRSRRLLATGVALLILALAVFLQSAHLGYEIDDPSIGRFRSRYTASVLMDVASERSARWAAGPPGASPRISREDHYLSEAVFHVQRRNEAAGDGDWRSAWHENLILEKFYAPVLLLASPAYRWPPEQRASVAAMAAATPADAAVAYSSDAVPFPLYAWDRRLFWGVIVALLAAIAVAAGPRRRLAAPAAAV